MSYNTNCHNQANSSLKELGMTGRKVEEWGEGGRAERGGGGHSVEKNKTFAPKTLYVIII